jgi:3-dehydrosphinganine reductase
MLKYGIKVSIFYPANMKTPGFDEENKTKPEETKQIEGTASTQSADEAAEYLMNGLRRGFVHCDVVCIYCVRVMTSIFLLRPIY